MGETATVHGEPSGMVGVKSIIVDPDKLPDMSSYVDMVRINRLFIFFSRNNRP